MMISLWRPLFNLEKSYYKQDLDATLRNIDWNQIEPNWTKWGILILFLAETKSRYLLAGW